MMITRENEAALTLGTLGVHCVCHSCKHQAHLGCALSLSEPCGEEVIMSLLFRSLSLSHEPKASYVENFFLMMLFYSVSACLTWCLRLIARRSRNPLSGPSLSNLLPHCSEVSPSSFFASGSAPFAKSHALTPSLAYLAAVCSGVPLSLGTLRLRRR